MIQVFVIDLQVYESSLDCPFWVFSFEAIIDALF